MNDSTALLQSDSPVSASTGPAAPAADYRALSEHLSPVLSRYYETSWSHGRGRRLFDTAGRSYLDFACGLAVTILGHAHPAVSAAIHRQTDQLLHMCNGLGYFEPVGQLAAMLVETLPEPIDSIMFTNSGTEAIEGALKLARRSTGRPGVIAFSGAFHGRTFGSLSATTSNINYRAGHGPFLPDVHVARYPSAYRDFGGDVELASRTALDELRRLLSAEVPPQTVAAALIEPEQGEGGYTPAPISFLQGLRDLCDEHGILLVTDEIQTGYGRTGKMWGFEHAGIVPDIVCIAKGIANGLPLGAIASSRTLQERWGVGAHGTTFGGNPVACAAGVAVLDTIREERLIENAAERGRQLRDGLIALAGRDERIGDVRGLGMMLGVELVKDRMTREPDGDLATAVSLGCAEAGLLILTCGPAHNVIRWIPPLNVTADECREALGIFEQVLGAAGRA